ncbi:hypothetical protein HNQ59_001944 [Chitinivorax tropicus]|uniref:Uncharacterized protein n=1 Tax=Chitinivorax tropicus TaxID=714531 RepID=A0A840MR23_9PROT|nr:hypothetical protein [Chitinivorax tropicus]MBB5018653.1 hypothetical protein [Chitinivorax tropicus]
MGSVVELASYRPKTVRHEDFGPAFYCTRCACEQFYLHASGDVRCVKCNAIMRNISVIVGRVADSKL